MKTLLAALVLLLATASSAGAESALPLPCTGCPPGSAIGNLVAFAAVSAIALRWRRS
jgi:hypothetical protein